MTLSVAVERRARETMRLLNVINSIDPAHGGPIEGVKQLGAALRALGHSVEVASMDAPGSSFVPDFPLPIHALGPPSFRNWYAYSKRFVPWLRENAGRYDVVVVNGLWGYASFGTWRGLRGSTLPYVVVPHGMLDPWFKRQYPLKHIKKSLYWPWAEYRVLRDASAVIFTSEEERLLARQSFKKYSANERVVTFGTMRPSADEEGQTKVYFDCFPETRGKHLVLFLGRLHPKKGCDLAIRAFARILGSSNDWHLLMVGPDQVGWKPELLAIAEEAGAAGRVTLTGMVSADVKLGAVRASEVLLLPSHQENFGLAVAEALACGVPVLLSNKVNIWREVVADGAGFAAEDDLEGTSQLLRRWLDLGETGRVAMRKRALHCFETRFEISGTATSMIGMLESVMQARMEAYAQA